MQHLPVLSALLALASAHPPSPHHHFAPKSPPLVSTSSGHIHGKIDPDLPGVAQYLGIPYAQPPVKNLRFAAPQSLSQPDAKIEATELPPSCMQFLSSSAGFYTSEVLEFNLQGLNRTGDISEDCLTGSIWAPVGGVGSKSAGSGGWWRGWTNWWKGGKKGGKGHKSGKGLPVLVYVYGGGFNTGGQDVPYQIPAQWVQRSQEHIVVSFNYRVNIFGFPNAEGLPDQNVGLLDQRLFVEWVQQNIAAFGGDPDRITIWGQSAGAFSVDYYNFAYPEDPIVKGLIMDSGTANAREYASDTSNFTSVANALGCPGDASAQLTCMRALPASTIENYLADTADDPSSQISLTFNPIADNKVVFSNYTARALADQSSRLPAIIGTNTEDGVPFAPYSPSGPDPELAQQALLQTFFCPATETIHLRQETGLITHRYLYAGNFTNISPKPWMGAYHSAELPMLHGTHPNFRGESSELEYRTSEAFQDAYLAFVKDPQNGLAGQHWPVYERLGAEQVRKFGDDPGGVPTGIVSLADMEAMCDGRVPA